MLKKGLKMDPSKLLIAFSIVISICSLAFAINVGLRDKVTGSSVMDITGRVYPGTGSSSSLATHDLSEISYNNELMDKDKNGKIDAARLDTMTTDLILTDCGYADCTSTDDPNYNVGDTSGGCLNENTQNHISICPDGKIAIGARIFGSSHVRDELHVLCCRLKLGTTELVRT